VSGGYSAWRISASGPPNAVTASPQRLFGSTRIEADELPTEPDAADDFARSLEAGYAAIGERQAAGGLLWVPRVSRGPPLGEHRHF
jgi:hypothetical protein